MNRAQDQDLIAAQMQLLWVGNNEKEFAYLRDVLTRSGEGRLGLDRARSPEEALQRLNQTTYDSAMSVARAIRYAVDVYCKKRQHQKAEDTVRKLWRAVEQSADLVIITDRGGVIEYVNPAFEALTGYSREESVGRTPRILKSDQQTANLYQIHPD